jgi:hypothetical protein
MSPKPASALILCVAVALPVIAGRPLTTEDASVLEDKACQVEAWIDRGHDASTGWFVPACNFGGGIEWQTGFARTREAGESRFSEAYAQAKGLFRESSETSPWGVGWVLGVARRPLNESKRGWDNPYALLPVSVSAGEFTFHVQPGWARDRERRRDTTVWGVAGEFAANDHLTFVAEAFGENSEKPFVRGGLRWTAIKDRLDIDLTYVARPGGTHEDRLVSLGFAWQSGKFLP